LVFYTAHKIEQSLLDHIQRAAARIDISNFFILIVCPRDITTNLHESNQKFGQDQSVIQSMIVPLVDSHPLPTVSYSVDSLCPLPFMHSQISAKGDVRPCCKFNGKFGTLSTNTVAEIFTGPYADQIRNQMKNGQRPTECAECWKAESLGTTSLRQMALQNYDHYDEEWVTKNEIHDITWSPVSLCNFTCRICNAGSSSSIAVEELKFASTANEKKQLRDLISTCCDTGKSRSFIQNIADLPYLEYLHILGGEPFLWPHLGDLVDELIANGTAKKISLELTTNCSRYPEKIIARIMENFHAVDFLLSIDNTEHRFEIERGDSWENICNNVKKFAMLNDDKINVKLAVTVNLQNILYLDSVTDFAQEHKLPVLWWYLEDPPWLSIDRVTAQAKQLIKHKYKDHQILELRSIAQRVAAASETDGTEFIQFCKKIDRRRGQNFSESHAEIFHAMGG
jgi:MoaA/NifB/PqqE/SkfB family radical SAM enzyme